MNGRASIGYRRLRGIPWWGCSLLGRLRLVAGHYDRTALVLLHRAWRIRPTPANLVVYLRWRRALGYPIAKRFKALLLDAGKRLAGARQRLAVNLLEETWPGTLTELPVDQLGLHADFSPPIAAELEHRGTPLSGRAAALAAMHRAQPQSRADFVEYLRSRPGKICVVGNAATLVGSGLGDVIDGHDIVVRFNRFALADQRRTASNHGAQAADNRTQHSSDTGLRADVWVRVLELPPPYPPAAASTEWVIISGADLRYLASDWRYVTPLVEAGHKVLTFPLDIWTRLVHELHAPPSAGVLALAWMVASVGDPSCIAAAGFQRRAIPGMRYHVVLRGHRAGRRHNWEAERRLLSDWERSGMVFLD